MMSVPRDKLSIFNLQLSINFLIFKLSYGRFINLRILLEPDWRNVEKVAKAGGISFI